MRPGRAQTAYVKIYPTPGNYRRVVGAYRHAGSVLPASPRHHRARFERGRVPHAVRATPNGNPALGPSS